MINQKKIIEIAVSLGCLFVGGIIYIAFRSKSLLMFSWFDAIGLSGTIDGLRECASTIDLPYSVKYCIPNAFWTISYILMVDALVSINNHKVIWAVSLPIIAIMLEFGQKFGVVAGTFDIGDILCYAIPTVCFVIYTKFIRHERCS